MNRLSPVLIGIFGAVFLVSAAIGTPIIFLAVLPIVGLSLAWTRWGGGRVVADGRWAAASTLDSNVRVGISVGQPDNKPDANGGWGATVRALGRMEGRYLARSPWFGAGIGFCVMNLAVFVAIYGADNSMTWSDNIQSYPWYVHPFVGTIVVAAHRAVTRAGRDGTTELFDTCPIPTATRTAGFLASAWLPVAAMVVYLTIMTIGVAIQSPLVHGPIDRDDIADVLSAIALPAGGVALGVALGRWVRFALAPIIAVVAIGFATTVINGVGGSDWNPLVPLSTAPTIEGPSAVFADRPAFWHLVWILGLVAVVGVIAVARDRRDKLVLAIGGMAIGAVAVAGIGATRPMGASSASLIADRIAHPEAHQQCRVVEGRVESWVEVCMFALDTELLDEVVDFVQPVAEALPSSAGGITLRQVYDEDLAQLPPAVRSRLSEADLARPASEVRLGSLDDVGSSLTGPSRSIAFSVVGLPTEADDQFLPVVVSGQSRGVIAIWLATRGLEGKDLRTATTAEEPNSPDAFTRGTLGGEDACSVPSVVWSGQDLQAARSLIELPDERVSAVFDADWDRWIDPATSTDELLATFGLDPVGPFDTVVPRPGNPC